MCEEDNNILTDDEFQALREQFIDPILFLVRTPRITILNPYPDENGNYKVINIIDIDGPNLNMKEITEPKFHSDIVFDPKIRRFKWEIKRTGINYRNDAETITTISKQCKCIPMRHSELFNLGKVVKEEFKEAVR